MFEVNLRRRKWTWRQYAFRDISTLPEVQSAQFSTGYPEKSVTLTTVLGFC